MQSPPDAAELGIRKSRPAVTDIPEPAVGLVDAEQQRAEKRPRSARVGPPPDDARLTTYELELPPVGGPTPRYVRCIETLGDQPFPTLLDRAGV